MWKEMESRQSNTIGLTLHTPINFAFNPRLITVSFRTEPANLLHLF